jgi:hypothetical protein
MVKQVKTIDWYNDIPPGSVIHVEKELKTKYIGIWASCFGSYKVKIEKKFCIILENK